MAQHAEGHCLSDLSPAGQLGDEVIEPLDGLSVQGDDDVAAQARPFIV
jgi:hypothetical protein